MYGTGQYDYNMYQTLLRLEESLGTVTTALTEQLSKMEYLMRIGYAILGLTFMVFCAYILLKWVKKHD